MKYTDKQREDAGVKACAEWLKTRWGQEYAELIRYLPENRADEVRQMLQQSIRQAMSHRPNELISAIEVDRQYKNLLDSNRLETYENLAALFRDAAIAAEKAQSIQERQKAAAKAIQDKIDAEAAFQQSILDRQKEDALNRELAKTKEGMRELRRKSLYPQVRTSSQSVPMPQSVKRITQNLSQ